MAGILAPAVEADTDGLLAEVRLLHQRTLSCLGQAEQAKRIGTAVMAIREARANLELIAKLTGVLDERPQVNILVHPDWLSLQDRIITALAAHPAALEAVRDAVALSG